MKDNRSHNRLMYYVVEAWDETLNDNEGDWRLAERVWYQYFVDWTGGPAIGNPKFIVREVYDAEDSCGPREYFGTFFEYNSSGALWMIGQGRREVEFRRPHWA